MQRASLASSCRLSAAFVYPFFGQKKETEKEEPAEAKEEDKNKKPIQYEGEKRIARPPAYKVQKATIGGHNIQRGLRSVSFEPWRDWEDIVYRYYGDVDALKIYFIRASPGLIYDSDPLTPNICLDLDENEKIVALEVKGASHLLACHFYDRLAPVDGKSPMSLNCSYYREEDVVEIWFVNAQAPLHYDHEVMIELRTKEGHIAGFRFPNASTSLCRHTCVPVNNRNCLFSGSEQ